MSSTKISDLPDSVVDSVPSFEIAKTSSITGSNRAVDILVVFGLLLAATNSEVSKSILRFPLLKLQKTDLLFSVLLSIIFAAIYAAYKLI